MKAKWAAELAARTGSFYPEPFRSRVLPREKRALGDAFGLTKIGVNLTTLMPGVESSMRHAHSHEDELVYLLEGELILVSDGAEERIEPGMVIGFKAGDCEAHQLINRGPVPAVFIEISNRDPLDTVQYPDVDLRVAKDPNGAFVFSRKDGSAY